MRPGGAEPQRGPDAAIGSDDPRDAMTHKAAGTCQDERYGFLPGDKGNHLRNHGGIRTGVRDRRLGRRQQ